MNDRTVVRISGTDNIKLAELFPNSSRAEAINRLIAEYERNTLKGELYEYMDKQRELLEHKLNAKIEDLEKRVKKHLGEL